MRNKLFANWLYIALIFWVYGGQVCAQQPRDVVRENSDKVSALYKAERELLNYEEIVRLATEIVQFRQQYPKDVIAQAYVLLSEAANSKGDSARAFQFAVDGLTYKPLPPEIQLNLELKLAAGYFVKGKYHNVFHFVEQVHDLAKEEGLVKYQLLALAYRSMANALIGETQIATDDLLAVKKLVNDNREYSEHIELLEVIAIAYQYLGDHNTSVEMHERILKLRFALNKLNDIDRTYYNLANAYRQVGRHDDAYNAFWEVKKSAEAFDWPIKRAYAELGIGQVLLDQQDYDQAYKALVEAENSFKGQNLNKPYLSTLIALVQASLATDRREFAFQLLGLAEELAEVAEVSGEQIELFLLLAQRYEFQDNKEKALTMMNKYVELQQQFYKDFKTRNFDAPAVLSREISNKDLALDLAQSYEVHTEFANKLEQQKQLVAILILCCVTLVIVMVVQWLSYRSKKHKFAYEQLERPSYILATPAQTKYIYHRAFKKARKYEYPLTVGYIVVSNWQDLTFSFSKKVISEVNKTIATLINEHLGEFDQAGQIHEAEYLVLFPHQTEAQAKENFDKLLDALKVRFFANLGEFSVNIRYSMSTPTVQDIDPYIFLSRLSDVS